MSLSGNQIVGVVIASELALGAGAGLASYIATDHRPQAQTPLILGGFAATFATQLIGGSMRASPVSIAVLGSGFVTLGAAVGATIATGHHSNERHGH
jgi:hypothetical protein